jgi:outer membrane protein assembly factor BamE
MRIFSAGKEPAYDIVFRAVVTSSINLRRATMRRILPVLLIFLAACASTKEALQATESKLTDYVTPYRIDVRQGNFVTQDMVAQLKPGQTKDQVRFILGTPLVSDPFHAERWDYIYRFQHGREKPQQRQLIVFFDDGKLARVGGNVVASNTGAAAGKDDLTGAEARVIDLPPDPNGPKTEPDAPKPEPEKKPPPRQ